jgi:hypothetical protein
LICSKGGKEGRDYIVNLPTNATVMFSPSNSFLDALRSLSLYELGIDPVLGLSGCTKTPTPAQ